MNQYAPDHASPPGETLLEKIQELGMPRAELARQLDLPESTVNEIIKGKENITPDTALRLELVLGISAKFWIQREARYRQHLARAEEMRGYIEGVTEFEGSNTLSYRTRGHVDKTVFRDALRLECDIDAPLEIIEHLYYRNVPAGPDMPGTTICWPSKPGRGAYPVTEVDVEAIASLASEAKRYTFSVPYSCLVLEIGNPDSPDEFVSAWNCGCTYNHEARSHQHHSCEEHAEE